MTKAGFSLAALAVASFVTACSGSGSPGGGPGTGGASGNDGVVIGSGSGGSTGSGGNESGSGGSGGSTGQNGSGGATPDGSGGSGNASGSSGSGGGSLPGSGGAAGSGNVPGTATGGGSGSGGKPGSGGATGSGGGTSSGGVPGSGGAPDVGTVVITSGKGSYWQTATFTEVTSGTVDVTVNDTSVQQSWDGFGGAFNEMGWDDLMQLSEGDRNAALHLLFDQNPATGARFVFGRIPIGASDYAMDRYTLNENANDFEMTKFSIDRDRQKLIPYVKAALGVNPNLRLWASPWSPPTWMKDNNAFDGGNMRDDAKVLQAHALYLAKFVQEYAKENIKIEAVHPQNEPGYATGYPSCLWTAALYSKFVGMYLGPTFASQNVTADIYLGTMSNGDSGKDGTIVTTVTGDSTAMKYIKGFGMQWNMLPAVSGLVSKKLPIIQSEHKCGNYPWETSTFKMDKAPNDHAYAIESWGFIRDWIKAGVNSYSSWNMVLDTIGAGIDSSRVWPQNALIVVDRSAKKVIATPAYFVFRHVSAYVVPGAKRVATSGNAEALAFKNPDGSVVAIFYNSGSSTKKTIIALGGTKLQLDVPATGWVTVRK